MDEQVVYGGGPKVQHVVNDNSSGGSADVQYADGATVATPTGNVILGKNGGAVQALASDGSNALKVHITANDVSSSGGTSAADGATFTASTTAGTPTMGAYHSTIDTVSDGKVAIVGLTPKRGMMVNLQTAAGVETGIAAAPLQVSLANTAANATAVKVDGSAVTQPTSQPGFVSTNNSSTATLTANSVFTGTADDVTNYGSVTIQIFSDQASATNGLSLQFSPDNSNWDLALLSSVTASTAKLSALPVTARYFRVVYTNGSVNQATMRLTTILHPVAVLPPMVDTSADGTGVTTPGLEARAKTQVFNGTSWDRSRSVINSTDSTGTGIVAAGLLAQLDDTSPSSVTENQFGNVRMGAKRSLHTQLRDAAGNDRGANIDASNRLSVTVDNVSATNISTNVAQINAVTPLMGNGTTGTGSQRVTIASDNTAFSVNAAATLAAETTKVIGTTRTLGNIGAVLDGVNTAATAPANGVLGLGIYNSTEPSPTTGQSVGIQLDSKGRQREVIMDAAGNTRGANVTASNELLVSVNNASLAVTESGTWTVQPGNTANSTPWLTTQTPATTGGLSYALNSIKATATSIKASAGQVFGWYIGNSNSSAVYVQFFNTASGSVTLGTTVPVYSLYIPATSAANVFVDSGIAHSTAIVVAATTTAVGNTAPTNNVDINIFYK